MKCPHCGEELTGKWMKAKVDWHSDGRVEREVLCPECGEDITDAWAH